ncbi:MAG: ATP-dependent DNA ligase [Bacteroidota bacterium]
MTHFAALYEQLDRTTKTNAKVAAMAQYFETAGPADAAWVVYFLSGRRQKRLIQAKMLRAWAADEAGLPEWLFRECYDAAGDVAETITLVLPERDEPAEGSLATWVHERLLPLRDQTEDEQRASVTAAWQALSGTERFIWNKLLTGGFRVGVSQKLLVRALASVSGVDEAILAHRLMGTWEPTPDFYLSLLSAETTDDDHSRPYPFYLAYPIQTEDELDGLGARDLWQIEWKWDGIRAQVIKRRGEVFVWSRGEELVTDRYPEVVAAAEHLPDGTVLDGELLAWRDGVLPFAQLQRRIGRKKVGKKLLAEVPVVLMAFDVLEAGGEDVRERPTVWRREQLEALIEGADGFLISEILETDTWGETAEARAGSRQRHVEGLMLKRKDAPYRVGRKRGDWWKWKVDPYTIDAVMIYAQRGSGRRASLYSDYTFAVWEGDQLVPFAKAYSGLTDEEMRKVDAYVRRSTKDRFGPVRSVTPKHVFEIGFEGIQTSSRHKSGVAVRFPRILRWRHDKPIEEADTLETLKALIVE